MEIRNLLTFVTIAETGSFTKAAESLGYTQSTVSFQIKQLEDEFQVQLFDRINRRISLTDDGRTFLDYAVKVLKMSQEFRDSFHAADEPSGHIRIATSDSICEDMMLTNYQDFYAHYPKIELEFVTAGTNDLVSILDRNEADIIFTLDNHIYRNEYVIAKEEPVGVHFYTAASSPLTKKKELTINDIINYPFLLTEKGTSYRKILDEKLARISMEINPVLELVRTDVLCYCTSVGDGITFLPDFAARRIVDQGSLVCLDIEGFNFQIWKQLIYHKNKWISRPLASFIEYVKMHEFGR